MRVVERLPKTTNETEYSLITVTKPTTHLLIYAECVKHVRHGTTLLVCVAAWLMLRRIGWHKNWRNSTLKLKKTYLNQCAMGVIHSWHPQEKV